MRSDSVLSQYLDAIFAFKSHCIEWALQWLTTRVDRTANSKPHYQETLTTNSFSPLLSNGAIQEIIFTTPTATMGIPIVAPEMQSSGTVDLYVKSSTGINTSLALNGAAGISGGSNPIVLSDTQWTKISVTRLRGGVAYAIITAYA